MAKHFKRSVLTGLSVVALCGCSSLGKSTGAGAGAGAVVGGVAGSFLPGDDSSRPKNVLIGAVTGATVGALSGALIHRSMEEKEREAFEKGKSSSKSNSRGTLVSSSNGASSRRYVPPKIERRWVEDEIKGNILVEGHYEQVIVEEGRWE